MFRRRSSTTSPCALLLRAVRLQSEGQLRSFVGQDGTVSVSAAISGVGVMQEVRALTTNSTRLRSTTAEQTLRQQASRLHSEPSSHSLSHSPNFAGATIHWDQQHLRHGYLASTTSRSFDDPWQGVEDSAEHQLLHCHLPAASAPLQTSASKSTQSLSPNLGDSSRLQECTTTIGLEQGRLTGATGLPTYSTSCHYTCQSSDSSKQQQQQPNRKINYQQLFPTVTRRHSLWSLPTYSVPSWSEHQQQSHRCYGTLLSTSANRRMKTGLKVAKRVIASSIEGKNEQVFQLLNDTVPVSFRKLSVKVCIDLSAALALFHFQLLSFLLLPFSVCCSLRRISSCWSVLASAATLNTHALFA